MSTNFQKLKYKSVLKTLFRLPLLISVVWLSGCAHSISFQDLQYDISSNRYDESVITVIDSDTLDSTVSIRSLTTGIAHSWDARPGQMLKQITDIELPQMFKKYKFSESIIFASQENRGLTLVMTIPEYQFRDFHAFFTVNLVVYTQNKEKVLERRYREKGSAQGGKMFWAGAFGMKSAVRQSSLAALKKIFQQIRSDLVVLLSNDIHKKKDDIDFGF